MAEAKLYIGVNNVQYPSGEKLHDIAIYNEFGTETAPPRPAFREGAEKGLKTRKAQITAALSNIARSGLQKGKRLNGSYMSDREKVLLTGIGQSAVKEIKEIIKVGSTVQNAPATVKKKGFDHPLYDTGELLKNVNYVVA